MNKINQATYFEENDFADLMKSQKPKRMQKSKRITINISEQIYNDAKVIDEYMHMGYQNVLKAAITLGLKELQFSIDKSVINKEK